MTESEYTQAIKGSILPKELKEFLVFQFKNFNEDQIKWIIDSLE